MNSKLADINFERNKNIKALTITVFICGFILLFFLLTQWSLPIIPPPTSDEGIEVNLGNSETGLGDVAPETPGETSVSENNSNTTPLVSTPVENVIDDKGDVAISASTKPVKIVPTPKEIKPATIPIVKPIITPKIITPKEPTPKAVFSGGIKTNPGGNKNDSYNGVKNQGIAGGIGDQGNPNGNPNSDSYTGNSSSGNGINIKSGLTGRTISRRPSFQDDFNENAKVAVDVVVNEDGKVLSAIVNPRGTTTTNKNIRQIATTKAMLIKFSTGSSEQKGTISFDFRITH